jgi:hypothetical protein
MDDFPLENCRILQVTGSKRVFGCGLRILQVMQTSFKFGIPENIRFTNVSKIIKNSYI